MSPSCAKRDFAEVMKVRLLRWGQCPGLSRGPNLLEGDIILRGRLEGIVTGWCDTDTEGVGAAQPQAKECKWPAGSGAGEEWTRP